MLVTHSYWKKEKAVLDYEHLDEQYLEVDIQVEPQVVESQAVEDDLEQI